MSEPEKKSESTAVRPKTSINVQQFSGLFQKSRSPDVKDNALVGPSGSSVLGVNRNGILPLPNNVNLARTVRPLFQKPALSPVDLKKLNEYISSAKKNVANGEANPGASQEPPSQGKVTGKEMEKDKKRENVIKRSKLSSKPTACKTKCEQENAIGSSSFEPTKNSNGTAHYSLGTSSEVEGVDQFANTKTGVAKQFSQPITVVKSSNTFGDVDVDVVLSPTGMPRPLASSSKESLDNLGICESAKPQQPLPSALRSNALSNNNLTSSQLSLNSNNSGKVVSFSNVVLKKKMEGESTKIPVVVLRRSKSDVQSSKHGSRESLMTPSEASPIRKPKAPVVDNTSEWVMSETEDVKISRQSTESLHRSVVLDPVNVDSKGLLTERGVVMNINVHVDRKGSKSSLRHTVSSKSTTTLSQNASRESLHEGVQEPDESELAEISRISAKSAETKSTQTIPNDIEEPIKTSKVPIVEKIDHAAQVSQPTYQNSSHNGSAMSPLGNGMGAMRPSNSLSSEDPPPRRVRSCTTIHLAGIVDHDDDEISHLGMKLSEQLAETKTMLEYLIDEKNQNSSIFPNKVNEGLGPPNQKQIINVHPNEKLFDSLKAQDSEFEQELNLNEELDEDLIGENENKRFHLQLSRNPGRDIRRKPAQVWNRQPREYKDRTSEGDHRLDTSYRYCRDRELGYNAQSQRPVAVSQSYWDRSNNNCTDRSLSTFHNESDQSVRTNRYMNSAPLHVNDQPQSPNNPRSSPIYYCSPVKLEAPVGTPASTVENIANFSTSVPPIMAPLLPGHDSSVANNNRYRGNPPTALKNYLNKANEKSVLQMSGSHSALLKPTPLNPTSVYRGTGQNELDNQQNRSSVFTNTATISRASSLYSDGPTTFMPLNSKTISSDPADYLRNCRNNVTNTERCQSCNSVINTSSPSLKAAANPEALIWAPGYTRNNRWTSVAREFQNERLATIQQTTNALRSSFSFAAGDRVDPRMYLFKNSRGSHMINYRQVDAAPPIHQRRSGYPSLNKLSY